jgi:ferritin
MLLIKKLSKMIKEEICDAEKYANCALKYKDEDRTLADVFYTLANEELRHMDMLHAQVVRLINTQKAKGVTVPTGMQEIYDYIHEEEIENTREVRVLLDMYKG